MAPNSNSDIQTDFQHAIANLQAAAERNRETGAQTLNNLLQVKSLLVDATLIARALTSIAHRQRRLCAVAHRLKCRNSNLMQFCNALGSP